MDGFRFYADYGSKKAKRAGGDAPNVIALHTDPALVFWDGHRHVQEAVAAVLDRPNSGVANCGVSRQYLREHCKRVGEKDARRMHPQMFAFLDGE